MSRWFCICTISSKAKSDVFGRTCTLRCGFVSPNDTRNCLHHESLSPPRRSRTDICTKFQTRLIFCLIFFRFLPSDRMKEMPAEICRICVHDENRPCSQLNSDGQPSCVQRCRALSIYASFETRCFHLSPWNKDTGHQNIVCTCVRQC